MIFTFLKGCKKKKKKKRKYRLYVAGKVWNTPGPLKKKFAGSWPRSASPHISLLFLCTITPKHKAPDLERKAS
jgi:hypothetical protein